MTEPEELEPVLRWLMQTSTASPKVWTDAYLAAFALGAGIRLVTFDRGFRQFSELDLTLL